MKKKKTTYPYSPMPKAKQPSLKKANKALCVLCVEEKQKKRKSQL